MEEKSRILKKVGGDRSRPVAFNDSFGGGDNQLRFLLRYLPDESFKDINLILNSTNHDLIERDKINVLWVHHFVNQKEIQNLSSKDYVDNWIGLYSTLIGILRNMYINLKYQKANP